jgi:nitrogen fixation protein FixH
VFTIPGGLDQLKPGLQPVVAPDGSVHIVLGAYAPSGSSLWSFPTPYPYNVFTPADIDSAGIHYFVQNLSQLFALNPDGSQRWHVALTNYLHGPIVDPQNTQLVMGSADTLDHAGFILSTSANDGQELWRVVLPVENPTVFNPYIGQYGYNQYVDTRARFTADGLTAYLVTATATGDNNTSRSFVYSLNASGGNPTPPPPPTATLLRSTSMTLSANLQRNGTVTVTGIVAVKDQNGAAIPSAMVTATWTLPNGTTQNQTVTTATSGNANFSKKAGRGTYTLTVTNITKTGYTFDKANSILTKSITK